MYADLGPGREITLDPPSLTGVDVMYSHDYVARLLRAKLTRRSTSPAEVMNLYAYVSNRSINSVDPNGLWPTRIHNRLIDMAFPNLSVADRDILKRISAYEDFIIPGQFPSRSYRHAMSESGESADEAAVRWTDFLTRQQSRAQNYRNMSRRFCHADEFRRKALEEFARGLHTLIDSTSPVHSGFQRWEPLHFRAHRRGERRISAAQETATIDLIKSYFKTTFPQGL